MVIVPVALISKAPPPAPGLELALVPLLSPPFAPEQPPRSGCKSVSELTAPAAPEVLVTLFPFPPLPPAVPNPPPPPPPESPLVVPTPPVWPTHCPAMLPPGPAAVPVAPASILPPESTSTLPATRKTMGLLPVSLMTWLFETVSPFNRTTITWGPDTSS